MGMQSWGMLWLIEHILESGNGDGDNEDGMKMEMDGDAERGRDGDGNRDGSKGERERYGEIDFNRRENIKEKTKMRVSLLISLHFYFSYFISRFQCRSFWKGHCPAPWMTLEYFHSNCKTILGLWNQHLVAGSSWQKGKLDCDCCAPLKLCCLKLYRWPIIENFCATFWCSIISLCFFKYA